MNVHLSQAQWLKIHLQQSWLRLYVLAGGGGALNDSTVKTKGFYF